MKEMKMLHQKIFNAKKKCKRETGTKRCEAQRTKSKMEDVNTAIATIILTAGGLNNPIKNQKLSDRMKRFNYKL